MLLKLLHDYMAKIYDNIESRFVQGLQDLITDVGVKRVDFCVGYFNLRGWDLVVNQIDQIPGDYIYENDKQEFRRCRLLIGMHQPDEELVRRLYSEQQIPDAAYVQQCKLEIARDFKKQLLLGIPTKRDEWTLQRLSTQLKEDKICVKLYVAEPLHAKLYLSYSPDARNKIAAILGSSNLTYAGLTKQGELDADIENNRDLAAFSAYFDQAKVIADRMRRVLLKIRETDAETAGKLGNALDTLGNLIKEAAK